MCKRDFQSSSAWLYGKLFVALLSQKMARVGSTISPWGYLLPDAAEHSEPVAREFQLAFHQVLSAITPMLPLQTVLQNWNEVASALSEPNRNRRPQLESLS
jgi:hypothetical protein